MAVLGSVVGFSFGSTVAKGAHLPIPVLMWWRLSLATLIWHGWCARPSSTTRFHRFGHNPAQRRAIRLSIMAGVLFGVNLLLIFSGILRTRVANAEFIIQLSPLMIVPIAARRLREHIDRSILVFGALAVGGVATILLNSSSRGTHRWAGDLLVAAGISIGVIYTFVVREARQNIETPQFMAIMSTAAALVVLPFAVATGSMFVVGWHGALFILVLTMLSSVFGHGLQVWAQRSVPLSTISLLGLSQPALAVTWAWIFLGEQVRPIQVLGMAFVLLAVGGIALYSPAGAAMRSQFAYRRSARRMHADSLVDVAKDPVDAT